MCNKLLLACTAPSYRCSKRMERRRTKPAIDPYQEALKRDAQPAHVVSFGLLL